ncbi:TetR/AcrR family transcriptional regulator [Rhodococcoides fascians]|uniref:TetR/AcrR family transcriptional regulator n=1 Tax=Rhodococcoides fascians TaxID=1828 RepID=UPI0019598B02|nr:TetR/AcrR family transcriptional regulator [Rhodococcus fascians]MDP9639378.1 AcrR family transcriptional regulator [Rhodococcus cercidiphylli]MDQ0283676.1 AcrR family transcriptional regulator [Rhodococcus fascians]
MGRTADFDRDAVVDAALDQFWAHGFHGTSTDMLCRATGLGRSSLYNAFRSKIGLYEECMSTYLTKADESADAILLGSATSVLDRIGLLFDDLIEGEMDRRSSGGPSGCFSVNTAIEAADDPELAAPLERLTANLQRRLSVLADYLHAGQATGEVSSTFPPRAQAEIVNGAIVGIRVAARVASGREAMRAIADGALRALTP